jgi:hypothetical protein
MQTNKLRKYKNEGEGKSLHVYEVSNNNSLNAIFAKCMGTTQLFTDTRLCYLNGDSGIETMLLKHIPLVRSPQLLTGVF